MQTFIPCDTTYQDCFAVLDKQRAVKQLLEALQIYQNLSNRPVLSGSIDKAQNGENFVTHINHPVHNFWRNNLDALVSYICELDRYLTINGKLSVFTQMHTDVIVAFGVNTLTYPDWWGNKEIHQSHANALLWKANATYKVYNVSYELQCTKQMAAARVYELTNNFEPLKTRKEFILKFGSTTTSRKQLDGISVIYKHYQSMLSNTAKPILNYVWL